MHCVHPEKHKEGWLWNEHSQHFSQNVLMQCLICRHIELSRSFILLVSMLWRPRVQRTPATGSGKQSACV